MYFMLSSLKWLLSIFLQEQKDYCWKVNLIQQEKSFKAFLVALQGFSVQKANCISNSQNLHFHKKHQKRCYFFIYLVNMLENFAFLLYFDQEKTQTYFVMSMTIILIYLILIFIRNSKI
ncbi:transmembrane protein, putative (macronuclear) [Tetrahymena thermophila SB210]|uniref:Transmembrane protein, putative n=1 Tax=Tetrahymena thermophila (strain SB210) TaxID=312017 RepID=W7XEX4_TETTS|nr:transmembrane protein, putative [Tetrahymena thermophila SB210]EWS76337.1 transmembrane protein, putative [Tetrahymena thermophila SB210]|eukprot:XP_012651121.1 transmembrane protein, putative [Tetrahymena thermophila SB210]